MVFQGISSHDAHIHTLPSTLIKGETLSQWMKVSG